MDGISNLPDEALHESDKVVPESTFQQAKKYLL